MMRKVVLLCILCALPVILFGQSKTIKIDWGEKNTNQTTFNTNTQFSNLQKNKNESQTLELEGEWVMYSQIWEDTRPVNPNSIRVTGIKYGSLTADELSRIDRSVLPGKLSYTLNSTYSRDKLYTAFTIVPVISEN